MHNKLPFRYQIWPWVILILVISLVCLPFAEQLSWNRTAIIDGQVWRIISGNFCHANLYHYLMNMLALLILAWMFQPHFKKHAWAGVTLIIIGTGSLGLFFSNYQDYVGFSGVLHGLAVYGAMADIHKRIPLGWVLLLGLIAKLALEQAGISLTDSAELIGMPVAIDAHLYFAICAALLYLLHAYRWHRKASRSGQKM